MGVSCREWRRTRLALIELELELGKLVLSIREKITQASWKIKGNAMPYGHSEQLAVSSMLGKDN